METGRKADRTNHRVSRSTSSNNLQENAKIFGIVLLALTICGTVAYALTILIFYIFGDFINESPESTFWAKNKQIFLLFLASALVLSTLGTICWHFFKDLLWETDMNEVSMEFGESRTRQTRVNHKMEKTKQIMTTSQESLLLSRSSQISELYGISRIAALPIPKVPTQKLKKRIVGFFKLDDIIELTTKQLSQLTHLVFCPIHVQWNGSLCFEKKEHNEKFIRLVGMAKKFNVKTMVSTGDGSMNGEVYATVVAEKRELLLNSIISFLTEHQIDGIDLYWRWPKTQSDYTNLISLCKELRVMYANHSKTALVISVALQWEYKNVDQTNILDHVDFVNVETNNYYAPWFGNTNVGPPSPLYAGRSESSSRSIDSTLKDYVWPTGKPNKLNMIVNFDGRFWNNVVPPESPSDTLWMTAELIDGKPRGGVVHWRDLASRGWDLSTASWNDDAKMPYIWRPEERKYMGFEDERSLREKVKYAIEKNIGGFSIKTLNYDDDDATLLAVISSANC